MRRFAGLFVVVNVIALVVVGREAHLEWRGEPAGTTTGYVYLGVVMLLSSAALGIPGEERDWQPSILFSAAASLLAGGVMALSLVVVPDLIPRFVLLVVAAGSFAVFVVGSRISWKAHERVRIRDRVVAVINGDDAKQFERDAAAPFPRPEQPFTLASLMCTVDTLDGGLVDACERLNATLIVLGPQAQLVESIIGQASTLHQRGIRIRSSVDFYDEWMGKLPLSEITHLALMSDISSVHGSRFGHAKRMVDILVGLLGLVAMATVILPILIGNAVSNRGPLFFSQQRVGLGGQTFTIRKFRTMEEASGADRTTWTSPDDPRITPFGRLLRRTHLDELPQSLNMLNGSLALVGSRPEQLPYVAELSAKEPMYGVRHMVKPGLTGWAQVKFRYAASESEAFEKLQYDLYYVRHQSAAVDTRIVSRTLRRLLFTRGR